jgi:hypothetical protein
MALLSLNASNKYGHVEYFVQFIRDLESLNLDFDLTLFFFIPAAVTSEIQLLN